MDLNKDAYGQEVWAFLMEKIFKKLSKEAMVILENSLIIFLFPKKKWKIF